MINKIIEHYPEEDFLKADGFDKAILGIDEKSMRLIYSVSKCIKILMKNMTREESIEYFDFNVAGAYMGKKTPIWCYDNF
jgi:hypothetical protein